MLQEILSWPCCCVNFTSLKVCAAGNFDFRCINSAMARNPLTEEGLKQPPTLHPQLI